MTVLEVGARRGRALVGGHPVGGAVDEGWGHYAPGADLPAEVVAELDDWARAADAWERSGTGPRSTEGVRVSRTGRHLAARVSVVLRRPVDYRDPVTGLRIPLRAVTTAPRVPAVPLPTRRRGRPAPGTVSTVFTEPTPWATGLTLAAIVAGLVLAANLTLALPLVAGLGWFGVLIDLVVVAGLVPALWLNRTVPTWRWAVWGAFTGMGLAVVPLLVAASAAG